MPASVGDETPREEEAMRKFFRDEADGEAAKALAKARELLKGAMPLTDTLAGMK